MNKVVEIFNTPFNVVDEITQKDDSYTLYLYTENINNVFYLKFGEAFKSTIWDRYNGTGCTQHDKIIKVWKSSVHDKPIHKILRDNLNQDWSWAGSKDKNPLSTEEAYIVNSIDSVFKFIKLIDDIVTSKKIGPDFYRDRCSEAALPIRKYQFDVIEKSKSILEANNRILLNLSTRSGKSYISLKICKELKASNILILTPFPSAEDSFKRLGNYNLEFSGYKYIHLDSDTNVTELCDKNIIFCSYQFYDNSKSIIKQLKSKIKFDFIILDECHHTSDSERTTNEILSHIKYNKLVYMSGTPFNDLYSGYFNKDEIVTFDFIDFIKYAKSHKDEIDLPELNIKNVCNLTELQNYLCSLDDNIFHRADAFDFDTVFSDNQHAESFFSWLLKPVETSGLIINKKRWFDLSNQKRIIAFFSSNKQVEKAEKALKKYYSGKVVTISGESADKEYIKANEDTINKLFEQENVVVLTCGKLTTGVTLPKLDTVWYFKSTASAEQFVQILFRTMTPCESKDSVSMYCFDTEASLKVIKEYATVRLDEKSTNVTKNEESDTFKSVLNEILSCINFTYLNDKFEFLPEEADVYFEKLHHLPYNFSVLNTFTNFHSFDGISDLGTELICNKDLVVSKSQEVAIRNQCDSNNKLSKLMKQLSNNSKEDHGESCIQSEKVVKQILKLLVNIDKKILVSNYKSNKIKSYKDLEVLWPPKDHKELIRYKDNFIGLLNDNKVRINQIIEDIKYKQDHNLEELLNSLSFSNETDMKTPELLIDQMCNSLSNMNGTIVDPCCGVGTIFECIRKIYNKPKNSFYGIELDPDNVAICHLLGYKNVIQCDASDKAAWKKLNSLLDRNSKKDMPKFDHIIMNPPYCKNLHLKILSNALDYSDDIVNLSPIRWIQDPLAELKKNSDWNRFKNIRERIESIEQVDSLMAESMFNIGLPFNLGIYHITDNKTNYCDKFKNPLISKMVLHIKDSIHNHIVIDDLSGISLLISLFTGGKKGGLELSKKSCWGLSKEKSFYIDCVNEYSHETYREYRNRTAWGNVKQKSENTNIKFNSKEERLNFYNSWNTKCLRYLFNNITVDVHVHSKFMPYLGDYTHSWIDEQLYEYFNLTEEEIKEIESIIK